VINTNYVPAFSTWYSNKLSLFCQERVYLGAFL